LLGYDVVVFAAQEKRIPFGKPIFGSGGIPFDNPQLEEVDFRTTVR